MRRTRKPVAQVKTRGRPITPSSFLPDTTRLLYETKGRQKDHLKRYIQEEST